MSAGWFRVIFRRCICLLNKCIQWCLKLFCVLPHYIFACFIFKHQISEQVVCGTSICAADRAEQERLSGVVFDVIFVSGVCLSFRPNKWFSMIIIIKINQKCRLKQPLERRRDNENSFKKTFQSEVRAPFRRHKTVMGGRIKAYSILILIFFCPTVGQIH